MAGLSMSFLHISWLSKFWLFIEDSFNDAFWLSIAGWGVKRLFYTREAVAYHAGTRMEKRRDAKKILKSVVYFASFTAA